MKIQQGSENAALSFLRSMDSKVLETSGHKAWFQYRAKKKKKKDIKVNILFFQNKHTLSVYE